MKHAVVTLGDPKALLRKRFHTKEKGSPKVTTTRPLMTPEPATCRWPGGCGVTIARGERLCGYHWKKSLGLIRDAPGDAPDRWPKPRRRKPC